MSNLRKGAGKQHPPHHAHARGGTGTHEREDTCTLTHKHTHKLREAHECRKSAQTFLVFSAPHNSRHLTCETLHHQQPNKGAQHPWQEHTIHTGRYTPHPGDDSSKRFIPSQFLMQPVQLTQLLADLLHLQQEGLHGTDAGPDTVTHVVGGTTEHTNCLHTSIRALHTPPLHQGFSKCHATHHHRNVYQHTNGDTHKQDLETHH